MNLPNKLTLLRILLVPVFMVLAGMTRYGAADYQAGWYLAAGVVFALASFTDFLDGYLARKWKMVTDFGKFADPLADKLLTTVAFLYMMRDGVCSLWVVALILAREFAVSGVRMLAASSNTVIAANMWGKVKTVLQMLTILFYFFAAALAGPTDVMAVSGWWRWPPCSAAASICGRTAPASCRPNEPFARAPARPGIFVPIAAAEC